MGASPWNKRIEVEFAASGIADGTVPLSWSLHALAPSCQQVIETLDIGKGESPICATTLTRLAEQGFVALLLSLHKPTPGRALTGQCQVGGG